MGRPTQMVPAPSNDLDAPMLRMRLQPYHRRIIQLMIAGEKQADIARRVGVTEASISRMKENPLFIAEYEKLAQQADYAAVDVIDRIHAIVPRALEIVEEFLEEKDPINDTVDPVKKVDRALEVLKMSHGELRGNSARGGINIHAQNAQVNVGDVRDMDDDQLDRTLEDQLRSLQGD